MSQPHLEPGRVYRTRELTDWKQLLETPYLLPGFGPSRLPGVPLGVQPGMYARR